jgi:hypothetical protein
MADEIPFHAFPHPDGPCAWCDDLSHRDCTGATIEHPYTTQPYNEDKHHYGGWVNVISCVPYRMIRRDKFNNVSTQELYREVKRLSAVPNLIFGMYYNHYSIHCVPYKYKYQYVCFGRTHVIWNTHSGSVDDNIARYSKFIKKYGDPDGFVVSRVGSGLTLVYNTPIVFEETEWSNMGDIRQTVYMTKYVSFEQIVAEIYRQQHALPSSVEQRFDAVFNDPMLPIPGLPESLDCPICMVPIRNPYDNRHKRYYIKIMKNCGAAFHIECLENWIRYEPGDEIIAAKSQCPVCFEQLNFRDCVDISKFNFKTHMYTKCVRCEEIFADELVGQQHCARIINTYHTRNVICPPCYRKFDKNSVLPTQLFKCPNCSAQHEFAGGCQILTCCLYGTDKCNKGCDHGSTDAMSFCGFKWKFSNHV